MKQIIWTTTACVTLSLAACSSIPPGDYCDVYQRIGPLSVPTADALIEHDGDAASAIVANERTASQCP